MGMVVWSWTQGQPSLALHNLLTAISEMHFELQLRM